jgi:predicted TIM-barrel fold metal-dependent hydrolase
MIVNFHEHPKDGLIETMAEHRIDVSVLLPVGTENIARAEALASEHPGRFVPFFWAGYPDEFDTAAERFVAARERGGGRGVKFQLLLQHAEPDDKRLYPLYEKCAEHKAPVVFHGGMVAFPEEFGRPHLSKYANVAQGVDKLAADLPELPIVMAHMGGNYHYEAMVAAEKRANVHLDTAYWHFFEKRLLPTVSLCAILEHVVSVLGPDRILYGGEGVLPSEIRQASIPADACAKILGENAEALLAAGA